MKRDMNHESLSDALPCVCGLPIGRVLALAGLAAAMVAGSASSASAQVAGGPLVCSGFWNFPLGGASLEAAGDRRFHVRTIGSSGQDGVSIKLNGAQGGGVGVEMGNLAMVQGSVVLQDRAADDSVRSSVVLSSTGNGLIHSNFDFSGSGVIGLLLTETDSAGTTIGSTYTPGPIILGYLIDPSTYCIQQGGVPVWWHGKSGAWYWTCMIGVGLGGNPHPDERGRQVRVEPVYPPGSTPTSACDTVRVTGTGVSEVAVGGSYIMHKECAVWGIGETTIDEQCAVFDPGTGACDSPERVLVGSPSGSLGGGTGSSVHGVGCTFPPGTSSAEVHFSSEPMMPSTTPTRATATFSDGASDLIAQFTTTLVETGGTPGTMPGLALTMTPTFAPGATCLVELLDQNGAVLAVIDSTMLAASNIFALPCFTGNGRSEWQYTYIGNGQWVWKWCNASLNFVLPGGNGVSNVGTVRGQMSHAGMAPRSPATVTFTSPDPSTFRVSTLITARACSLADLVGGDGNPPADGSLDGNDFQAFLNSFAAGDLLADIVGGDGNPPADGSVDGNDFQAFLNAFGVGC